MRISSIRPDDLVHVSIKGRNFYAVVTSVEDGHVNFRPICPGAGWRSAKAREVTGHWRGTRHAASVRGMTTDCVNQPLDAVLAELGGVIARFDRRRHILSARLDLALGDRCWVAQILADPLDQPLVGKGRTTAEALVDLHAQIAGINWRRVRR